jgi:hypothetical protein
MASAERFGKFDPPLLLRAANKPGAVKVSASRKTTIPAGRLTLYEKLVATVPGVERKGATHPYTSINGHMSSYLHPKAAMALRLPEKEREAFLAKYKTTLFEAYGVVQKEYVTVPDVLLANTTELRPYFEASCRYVTTLKPKAAKKRAASVKTAKKTPAIGKAARVGAARKRSSKSP